MTKLQPTLTALVTTKLAKLRITIVTETFRPEVNGVAMTLGRLVDGLMARGHFVQLVRPRQARETMAQHQPELTEVLVPGIPLPTYGELRFGLPSGRRLARIWGAQRPDIVHVATEGPLGRSAVAVARRLGLPLTSSFHTNFQSYSQHYGLGFFKSYIENYLRNLHNRTQATLVPTESLVRDLVTRGYKDVKLLSRGVAIKQFSPSKRSQELRESWGVKPDDVVVLLVGRLAKEKNVRLVITAFQSIKHHLPNAKLVFVGDGPQRIQFQAMCPQAVFAGVQQQESLAAHYASSDLFLFPSLTETFGNVVPEALASGLAVVSYALAAASELITSGKNGVLVTADDEVAFINASVQLACSRQLQHQYRHAAPLSVAHLDWDAICDSFLGTLTGVIEQHAQSLKPVISAGFSRSVSPASA